MAVTLPDDLIGDALGDAATPKALDGLTEITYDRVDDDYRVNEGSVTVKRQRLIVLKYTPPGGVVWADIYNAGGQRLLIKRRTTVGGQVRLTLYKTTVQEVTHRRFGANAEEFTIICLVGDTEMQALLSLRTAE